VAEWAKVIQVGDASEGLKRVVMEITRVGY
jgi:hypothetical protein